MKTPEELNALKEEVETMNKRLSELTEEELKQVSGGWSPFEWMEDIINWFTEPDTYEVSYNPLTGHYFCPVCNDGNSQLESRGYEYSDEGEYDKYVCAHCGAWFWHFRTGKYSGKWLKD